MSESNKQYLDVVSNAFKAMQAWKFATFALGLVVVALSGALIHQQRNTPIILVPHEMASSGGRVTVMTNGEIRGTSQEYLANTALSDLTLILNFTPDNVVTQTSRFLNRVTDDLYGRQRDTLLAQASEFKSRSVTQTFFPSDIRVSDSGNRVVVEGSQVRWVGSRETIRTKISYVITYKVYKGYLHVADLRQESETSN